VLASFEDLASYYGEEKSSGTSSKEFFGILNNFIRAFEKANHECRMKSKFWERKEHSTSPFAMKFI